MIWQEKYEKNHNHWIHKIIPYIFLLLLILIAINQFTKWSFLLNNNFEFIVLAIGLGVLTFWHNRERVESELESEKTLEEEKEKKKKDDFPNKFPRLSRIPIIGRFVRWMYKEGWWYSVALIVIVVLGFALRVWKLGKNSYWFDESLTSLAAKGIIKTFIPILPSGAIYPRSILYSYLTAFQFSIFGTSEISSRMISVFFGVIILILAYIMVKQISNKKISLISVLILAILPWQIIWSQQLRMYILLQLSVLGFIFSFYLWLKYEKRKYIHYDYNRSCRHFN